MRKIILDLDTGIDDSLALAYAALNPGIELLGVTGTYGNVETIVGIRNALDVLALVGQPHVPVFVGESHAINQEIFHRHEVSARIHGKNGVGQVYLPTSPMKPEKESATDFLILEMHTYQEDLTIVTTGPLTNLAKVILKDPSLKEWKGKVVMMGGALTVRGNVSHFAEANIAQDPEAARLVLESGLDVTMVGLDVTMRSRLTQKDVDGWRPKQSQDGRFLADMLTFYIQNTLGTGETYIHDPSAIICAIHPEFFTILPFFLTVETNGEDRGRTIVDHTRLRDRNPSTRICLDVESEKVERELWMVMNMGM
jgi:purine nucleosidase